MLFKKFVIPASVALFLFLTACVRTPSAVTGSGDCPENRQVTSKQMIILDNSDKE